MKSILSEQTSASGVASGVMIGHEARSAPPSYPSVQAWLLPFAEEMVIGTEKLMPWMSPSILVAPVGSNSIEPWPLTSCSSSLLAAVAAAESKSKIGSNMGTW